MNLLLLFTAVLKSHTQYLLMMISGSTEKAFKQIDILQQINVEFVACAFYYICFHLFIDLFVFPNTFFSTSV